LLSQGVQEEEESFRREGGNKVLVSKSLAFSRSPEKKWSPSERKEVIKF